MNDAGAAQRAWLDLVQEDILDPERPIVDPHHHLWRHPGIPEYLLEDLWADTGSGHHIVKTVFMECGAEYHEHGPEELRSLGEVEFVTAQGRYYLHMIECFTPERCMLESNFPVDKLSISYPVLWNGLKIYKL